VIPVIASLAVLVVAAASLAALAFTRAATPAPVSATTTSAVPNSNQVECVNVERAYNAWKGALALPPDRAGVQALRKLDIEMLTDDGGAFLGDVEGYQDQTSKILAFAVADYEAKLALANVAFSLGGKIDSDSADGVVAAITRLHDAYRAFKASTCA
jgi:hypothetical protein